MKGLPPREGDRHATRENADEATTRDTSPDARAHRTQRSAASAAHDQRRRRSRDAEVPGRAWRSSASAGTGRAPAKSGGRSDRERREGFLKVNPRGFGFVASPTASGDDVYISPENLGGAMHGDHVIDRHRRARLARPRGAHRRGQGARLAARLGHPPPPRQERVGRARRSAHEGPGRPHERDRQDERRGRRQQRQGRPGRRRADYTLPREPTTRTPRASCIAVLGAPGELSVETQQGHPRPRHRARSTRAQAIAEAEAYGATVPAEMLEGREDLTHIPLPTIDPEDARDHDDAVWVERTERRRLRAVGRDRRRELVRAAPAPFIDEESKTRGCSIYLPDRAIPMLPRALSSNLCSLLPDVLRLCLCVHAVLDAKGNVKKTRLVRGYMKSAGEADVRRRGARARLHRAPAARSQGRRDGRGPEGRRRVLAHAARQAHEARRARLRSAGGGGEARRGGQADLGEQALGRPRHEEGLPAHRGADDLRQRGGRALAARARAAGRVPRPPPARSEEAR